MDDRPEITTPDGLLAKDEPAPFEVLNPDAGGRVLLICDHASKRVPAVLDNLGLSEIELARHIGGDIGADDVTRRLSAALDAPAVIAGYSRLVIDCNRALDHPGLILPESDGTPVPANLRLSPEDRAVRISSLFDPYHAAIREQALRLKQAMGGDGAPVILSIHSFTPIMDAVERPWEIGILWNRDPRLPEPLIARLRAMPGLTVGDNEPYSARLGYGYTLERHGDGRGFANALIELRQDLIDTHHGAEKWAEILLEALGDVLQDEALFRVGEHEAHTDG